MTVAMRERTPESWVALCVVALRVEPLSDDGKRRKELFDGECFDECFDERRFITAFQGR